MGANPAMLSLLRSNGEFRRLYLAHGISRAGDAFNTIAVIVLAFTLTGSGRGVTGAVIFEVLPVLLIGPVAGMAADRLPRRRLMVGADAIRAGAAGILIVATGSLAVLFAVAFTLSAAATVFNPAAASVLPDVVSEDDLIAANSALWTAAVVAQIVVAPIAGVIIAAGGIRIAFAINAASFVISALLLTGLSAGRTASTIQVRGWRGALGGYDAVRAHPLLRRLAIVQVLASVSAGATSGLLVVLADRWLGVGPGGFAALLAAIGGGAAIGPMLLRGSVRAGDRRWLFYPYLVRGGVDITLATVANPVVAGSALVVYGMSTSTGMVAYQSTLQSAVTPDTRGRAFAFFDIVWNTARLISLAIGGVLADQLDVRWVYVAAAVLLAAAAVVGLTTNLDDVANRDSNG